MTPDQAKAHAKASHRAGLPHDAGVCPTCLEQAPPPTPPTPEPPAEPEATTDEAPQDEPASDEADHTDRPRGRRRR